jgi:hypothetical protein
MPTIAKALAEICEISGNQLQAPSDTPMGAAESLVRLVIARFKTLFAQVQKRKWTLVGSFMVIVYTAGIIPP